jgi:hypothetical protein
VRALQWVNEKLYPSAYTMIFGVSLNKGIRDNPKKHNSVLADFSRQVETNLPWTVVVTPLFDVYYRAYEYSSLFCIRRNHLPPSPAPELLYIPPNLLPGMNYTQPIQPNMR